MDAIQDRLQHAIGATIRLHRIGEDELSAGLQHARHFIKYAGTVAAMQNRILRPDDIHAVVVRRNVLEVAIDNLDLLREPRFLVQLAIETVLRLADIHTGDMTAIGLRDVACRTAIARADVEHIRLAVNACQHLGKRLVIAVACGNDRLVIVLVHPDMDVLATPDREVERIRIGAVVIGFGLRDRVRFTRRHYRFSPRREQRSRHLLPCRFPESRHRYRHAGNRSHASAAACSSCVAGTC